MRRISSWSLLWLGLVLALAVTLLLTPWRSRSACQLVSLTSGAGPEPAWAGEGLRLKRGKPVQCQLAGDAAYTHQSFRISLEAGQYMHLIVEQPEAGLSAVLWSPERKALLRLDTPPGRAEHLYFVASETGDYGLIISSENRGRTGSYRVLLAGARTPTQADRRRAEAAAILSQGEEYQETEEYESARERYEQALALWRNLDDSNAVLEVLYRLGDVKIALGQAEEAFEIWEKKVLAGWEGTPRQAMLLNRMGEEVLSRDSKNALEFHRRALKIAHQRGQQAEEMRALNGMIEVYRTRGEIRQGFETFRIALSLARSERDRSELFATLGDLFITMGDRERALQYYNESLAWPAELTEPEQRVNVLTYKGASEFHLGKFSDGLRTLREALAVALSPELVEQTEYHLQVLIHLGTLYEERYDKQRQDPNFLREAKSYFVKAREIANRPEDESWDAIAISYLGRILDLEGNERDAVDFFTLAHGKFSKTEFDLGRAGSLHGRARARRDLEQFDGALADIEEAIEILEKLRSTSLDRRARASFLENRRRFYQFQVSLLAELHERQPDSGYDVLAFEKSEEFRARSLLEALAERREAPDEVGSKHIKEIESLEGQLRELNPLLQLLPEEATGAPLEDLEAQTRDSLVQLEILRSQLDVKSMGRPRQDLLTVPEIRRQLLDEDTLMLAYMLGEEQSYLWSLGREGLELHVLAVKGRDLEKRASILANLFAQSARKDKWDLWQQEADRFSRELLAPVAKVLGRRHLIIVRDTALSRIPFEALPDPRELEPRKPGLPPPPPLMASNDVVYAPSASVLAKIVEKTRSRPAASKRLAAFGDPQYLGHLEPLPDSRTEVENIPRLLPEGQVLKVLGFETQRERFLELAPTLAQYEILHIATHSLEDQVFPELSSLVFSLADKEGQPRNGLLTYYEISNLDLPLDMVVLSACRTGSGKEIKGEGVLGLGRAFLHAGVSRVVVSLWDVNDEATAFLMNRFYEGMFHRNLSPPEALRQARLAVRSQPQWQAPYYWAPFVLEGASVFNNSLAFGSIGAGGTGAARARNSRGNFLERRVYMPDETQSPAEGGATTTPATTPTSTTEGDPKTKGDFKATPAPAGPKDKGDFNAAPAPASGTEDKP